MRDPIVNPRVGDVWLLGGGRCRVSEVFMDDSVMVQMSTLAGSGWMEKMYEDYWLAFTSCAEYGGNDAD